LFISFFIIIFFFFTDNTLTHFSGPVCLSAQAGTGGIRKGVRSVTPFVSRV